MIGLAVPELSVPYFSPGKQEIARLAVAQLFHRLKGDTAAPVSRNVGYRLVARESTRAGMNSDER